MAVAVGLFLLVTGAATWKWNMMKKATPWMLLLGSCVLFGATIGNWVSSMVRGGSGWLTSVLAGFGFRVSISLVLFLVGWVFFIYLVRGLHPKKGTFTKGHNIAAVLAGIVWGTAGGVFGSIVLSLGDAANKTNLPGMFGG